MRVVLDANVAASGIVFRGEAWGCLARIAHRRVVAFASEYTLAETRDTAIKLVQHKKATHNVGGALTWYLDKVRLVEPAPLGKQRSRDAKGDPYLAAALAARAHYIVTYDKDLLALEKPFGIAIIRPAQFLKLV